MNECGCWHNHMIDEIIYCPMHKAALDLLEACKFAFNELNAMTTDEFSKGGDKAIREKLAQALAQAGE